MTELNKRSLFSQGATAPAKGERGGSDRQARRSAPVRYTIVGLSILLMALLLPRSSMVVEHVELGSIWSSDTLRAPFAFPLYKDPAAYEQDIERAVDTVLPVFVPTGATATYVHDTLIGLARAIAVSEARPAFLSEAVWAYIASIPEDRRESKPVEIAEIVFDALTGPYRGGVIDVSKSSITTSQIAIRRADVYEEVRPVDILYDSLGALHLMESSIALKLNPAEASFAMELFYRVFRPMYRFSRPLTDEAIQFARENVPVSYGVVAEGEVIVGRGERITNRTKLKLTSFQRSRQLREVEEQPWRQLLGNVIHVSILVGLVMLYLYNFRIRIFRDNLQLGILFALMMAIATVSFITRVVPSGYPTEFLIPMPLLTMLLVILFDSRTAFYITVTNCFVVAAIRGADYSAAIACLSAGVLAIYAVRDIKSRTQLFRAIGYSLLGYMLAIAALGLGRGESWETMGLMLTFAAINATISPVLTFAVILLLENIFGIATDLKLLEYDNLNHPLLRALADKAPGTYQHTLTIARLAESAATAVGANALLAKVGSYFHDIGKLAKAEYFVENQMGMGNKHDRIKPERSAKIIRDHVEEGIELALQYGLPQRIVDFIPMHHGTTTIQYFLDKAREAAPEVDEGGFHYPGPLPQSRETGIVMLADAVEATTRSLANPTPKAIEETVDRMIKKRFSEGQLDQCELTLADLTKIKGAFVKNLVGMSHPRIQYKSGEGPPGADAPGAPRKQSVQEPVIPYIDDAFGNIDSELSYPRHPEPKREE